MCKQIYTVPDGVSAKEMNLVRQGTWREFAVVCELGWTGEASLMSDLSRALQGAGADPGRYMGREHSGLRLLL